MDDEATRARFADARADAGMYESFYAKAHDPTSSLGCWIRYTVLKRPRARPSGSLWFTLFDGTAAEPLASKVTTVDGLGTGDGAWIRIGDATFEPGRIAGAARSERCDAAWDLRFSSDEEPVYHLPRAWMYRAKIPRTKPISPMPVASFAGTLRVGERTIEVRDWPGMIGHNWGAEHAERWIWMHAVGFEGHTRATWLDATVGRIKLGPVTTPWVGNGVLSIEGTRYRLGGPERIRSTLIDESYYACDFTLPGKGIAVRGSVASPATHVVGWSYADPAGGEHHVFNGSIADMTLTVVRDGTPEQTMRLLGGAAYELGVRESTHGLPVQPFGEEVT